MSPQHSVTIIDAIADRKLFAPWFRNNTWQPWLAFLSALFALPMTPEQLAVYQQCTGRTAPPTIAVAEAWLVCGRRAGKSFMLALVAVYLACFRDYRSHLARGERGMIIIIAQDRKQARVIFSFIRGLLKGVPMLARRVERELAESFDLTNNISIEIHTASYRSIRGYTVIAALLDEVALWRSDDTANPDDEIIAALKPAMATIPNAMMLCASSPYARRGVLWNAYRKHFAKDGDPVLVWQAPTRVMNSTVPQSVVDDALAEDRAKYGAEYLAEFRTDVETFVNRDVVEAAVISGRYELPFVEGISYVAFEDPAGGSGSDSMTLCIGHLANDCVVVDLIREYRPPFSPDSVTADFCTALKSYNIHTVHGDNWAKGWPRAQHELNGVSYLEAGMTTTDFYSAFLPILNSGRIELLDHQRSVSQLCELERATDRGRERIAHPPGGHDDVINAVAGMAVTVSKRQKKEAPIVTPFAWSQTSGTISDPAPAPVAAILPSTNRRHGPVRGSATATGGPAQNTGHESWRHSRAALTDLKNGQAT